MGCGILEEQNNTLGIKENGTESASDAPRMQLWVSLMHKWGRRGRSLLGERQQIHNTGSRCKLS